MLDSFYHMTLILLKNPNVKILPTLRDVRIGVIALCC